ncbi:hypothetical protein HMPREF0012_00249 [Acinetobacter calcoaceticus RUH2202]|uniref:hypothetical protein n=1 Tax=Acinetobacter calcoaceticus TaxID=471 RepID=UPI0001BB4B09|nr:hypothetical protein [Acinetobacter calcoaceticus]EEY77380.1 hypothetical protein HMPREF0012_00249 [Acinetobacter calcoaceticus RUH2202]
MSSILEIIYDSRSVFFVLIGILTSIFSVIVLRFLNNSNQTYKLKNSVSADIIRKYYSLEKDLVNLKNIVGSTSKGNLNFTVEDKNRILRNLEVKMESESNKEYIENLKSNIKNNFFEEFFNERIERSVDRLRNEKNSAFIRGNFNLMIGVVISILGGIIAYAFIQKLPTAITIIELFSYTLPRLSFFILIIFLAFFFLNLYRKSMDDIKYYQNEITNLEAKYLSLQIAKSMNNHKLLSSILEQLMKTERNFVLEKDQSTIDLEKERLSSDNANNTLKTITDIFKNQK